MEFGTGGTRGLFEELNGRSAYEVGNIFAPQMGKKIVLAMDHRLTSPSIYYGLASGIMEAGSDVLELKFCPSPVAEFYNTLKKCNGLFIVTASHNPPEYNGIKVIDQRGVIISKEDAREMAKKRMSIANWNCVGKLIERDQSATEFYIDKVLSMLDKGKIKKKRFIVDYGNGVTVDIFSKIIKQLELDTIWLNATMDGNFPGRNSEPSEENLIALMESCRNHGMMGLAFDGDGDRLSMVDEDGHFVSGDVVFALAVKKMYEEGKKGDIAAPVATSKLIEDIVKKAGHKVIYTKIGATYVADQCLKKAVMGGGEEVGGTIWKELSYAKDGMFTALKILEMLDGKELKEAVKELPTWHAFKAKMEFRKMRKEVLMEKIKDMFKNDKINDMDGIRVDYKDYWIMIRPSGTEHNMLRVWASSREKEKAELKCKELIEKIERIFSENILD